MRRLDHSTILLLIAGTYTPFALLAFEGEARRRDPRRRLGRRGRRARAEPLLGRRTDVVDRARLHRARLGRRGRRTELFDLGVAPAVLVFVGGALYTLGALAYALKRPNPLPATFGYHEIFHLLVIGAAAVHFVAIAASGARPSGLTRQLHIAAAS